MPTAINPTLRPGDKRPYNTAKLKQSAIPSVAQVTGPVARTPIATGSVTVANLAAYVGALVQDLQTRGIIT